MLFLWRDNNLRKILMRSAMPLGEDKNISEVLIHNLVGDNTGNLLFQNSVARVIMTEDTEITTINVKRKFSQEEIERFNSEYEMFLIPLANAFRISFIDQFRYLTDLVERLTIPCVVIGIGIQRNLDATAWNYPYDEAATEFVKAVLNKSEIIGIRGELTAEYLKRHGFVPEKDFTVIGCPSLYTYGDMLPELNLPELTPKSKVSVNFKTMLRPELYSFIRKEIDKFEDCTFVTQVIKEIKAMYVGYPHPEMENGREVPKDYPIHFSNEMMTSNHMVGFLDQTSWLNYLATRDFNFGSRIHGDISSLLAGTPCYIFASDGRVKELAEYHNIPHMSLFDIKDDTDIFDLYEKADYSLLQKGHKQRVSHYLDFLDKNGVKRIDRDVLNSKDAPFDRMHQSVYGEIRPFPTVSLDEQERRIHEFIGVMEAKEKNLKNRYAEYRKDTTAKLKENKAQQKKLEKELALIKSSKFYKMKVKYDAIKNKFR